MLSYEQRGVLLTAVFAYSAGGPMPEMDDMTTMCFGFIRASLDANSERYQAICEKNRTNGSRGGRPSKKPDGLSDNRPVSGQTEGLSAKTRTKPRNPVESDAGFDSVPESDIKLDSGFVSEFGMRGEERELCLKVLLFTKKLLNPQSELDRFCTHYEKTGWVDANGNAIRNRFAALKAWTPANDAARCPAEIVRIWHDAYEAVAAVESAGCAAGVPSGAAVDAEDETSEGRVLMLTHFRGLSCENNMIHVTAADKSLVDFMEHPEHLRVIRPVLDRYFGGGRELHYRVPKPRMSLTEN